MIGNINQQFIVQSKYTWPAISITILAWFYYTWWCNRQQHQNANIRNEKLFTLFQAFSILFIVFIVCVRDLERTLVKEARWLFLCHFRPLLKWVIYFEAAGAVEKIDWSLRSNCRNIWYTKYVSLNQNTTAGSLEPQLASPYNRDY